MTVEWRAIVGYGGRYEVSSDGQVRSHTRREAFIRRPQRNSQGYLSVSLSRDGNVKLVGVHRLVALAFMPDHDGNVVRHLDGNPSNNHAKNLAWGTQSENAYDRVRHGRDKWANKTHCPAGHEYSEENTYRDRGGRHCRECNAAAQRRYQARRRGAAKARHEVSR